MNDSLQHFFPRTLASGWTDTGTKLGKLQAIRIKDGRGITPTPRNIGAIKNYNRIPEADNPNLVEEAFAKIEDLVSPVLEKIRNNISINPEERGYLLGFIAIQYIRPPIIRESYNDFYTQSMRIFCCMIAKNPNIFENYKQQYDMGDITPDELIDWNNHTEVKVPVSHHLLSQLQAFEPIEKQLEYRSWDILQAPDDTIFICADNSVVLMPTENCIDQKSIPMGVGGRDINVFMPIGHKHIIYGYYPYKQNVPEWNSKDINSEKVSQFNGYSIKQAREFIVYKNDDFTWRYDDKILDKNSLINFYKSNGG